MFFRYSINETKDHTFTRDSIIFNGKISREKRRNGGRLPASSNHRRFDARGKLVESSLLGVSRSQLASGHSHVPTSGNVRPVTATPSPNPDTTPGH